MDINEAISKAERMSYAADLTHVVGRINVVGRIRGEWQIADIEDSCRIAGMEEPIITVHGSGIDDQDWPWLEEEFPEIYAVIR